MRSENVPDSGHDKVNRKRIRDLLTRSHYNVTLRRGGDVPQRRYWLLNLGFTGEIDETY